MKQCRIFKVAEEVPVWDHFSPAKSYGEKIKICFANSTIYNRLYQKEGCHRDSPPISLTFNKSYTMKKHSANAVIQQ